MARDKVARLQAEPDHLIELIAVLRRYAEAAWPPGGSECAQASRESLLSTADALEAALGKDPGSLAYKRRQRAVFRAALEYHLEHPGFEMHRSVHETLLQQLSNSGKMT